MKVIMNGKRYSTEKAELVMRLQYSRDHIEQLWLTKKGSWLEEIQASGISEKQKTAVFVLTGDEAYDYLVEAQFAPPEAFTEDMDPQSVANIIEHYFPDKLEDE
ncbi:MAG: hypothetical protein JST26_09725 [Bacteroidetes bacterium]|nr:hypothetical protein [Bacteroidota bacterium]